MKKKNLIMSVQVWGGGLKALTDMSAKNVSFFGPPPGPKVIT